MRLRKLRAEPRRCSSRPLIASVGPLEVPGGRVGQELGGAVVQGAAEALEFDEDGGDAMAHAVDQCPHGRRSLCFVGVAVGVDHALIDSPGRFDLHRLVFREKDVQSRLLFVGEQSAPVCRVRREANSGSVFRPRWP